MNFNLLLLDDSTISRFHKVSDFNFNLFLENLDPDYEESYLLKNNEKPIYYKRLLITSYYKWNKNYIYSLTERNYELFEYIYMFNFKANCVGFLLVLRRLLLY